MVYQTYKDKNNNWLSPEEVFSEDGKKYFIKNNPTEKVYVGASESMSKSKKNTIDPEKIIETYGADAVDYSYYQIALLKKIYSGQKVECPPLINLSKNFGL